MVYIFPVLTTGQLSLCICHGITVSLGHETLTINKTRFKLETEDMTVLCYSQL